MRWLLATLLVAISTDAAAEPKGTLRDAAVRLFESQDYAKAAEAFQRCYQVEQEPACLYGQGQAYRAAGDCARAITAYRAFLRTSPPSEPRQKALLNIAACEQQAIEAPTPAPSTAPVEPVEPAPPATVTPAVTTQRMERAWYRDRLGGVLAGSALVAGAAGASFLVLAGRSRDDAAAEGLGDGSHQVFEVHRAQADRRQLVGTVVLGGASALALAAVLRYALHDRTTEVTVSTSAIEGARSLAVAVRF